MFATLLRARAFGRDESFHRSETSPPSPELDKLQSPLREGSPLLRVLILHLLALSSNLRPKITGSPPISSGLSPESIIAETNTIPAPLR
jgi:hypothetical protein